MIIKSKLSQEEINLIKKKLDNNESMCSIAKSLNRSVTAVRNIKLVYKPDLKNNFGTPKFSKKEEIEEIKKLYKENKSVKELKDIFNCSETAIRRVLKEDIPKRILLKRDSDYFSKIDSQNKAYIVGFTAADGCITSYKSGKNNTLTYSINKKDIKVLEFIKKELKSEHNITYLNRNNLVRFCLNDNKLCEDLIKLGVTKNKSKTLKNIVYNIPEEFRNSFLLGYFDGDGSIYKVESKKQFGINIRGTYEFLSGYLEHFNIDHVLRKYDSTWILAGTRKQMLLDFYYKMYLESPPEFFLERKYNKFLQFIEEKCQDKTISSPSL